MPIVGIDYTPATEQGGGIGRYVRELVSALAQVDSDTPYRLFVSGAHKTSLPASPGANFAWKATPIGPEWLARIWQRARLPLPVETFTGRMALYHATDFVLPPTLPNTKTLLTVHDLSFVRVPEAASPGLRAYLDVVVPRSVRRADYVLADSQATKDDLVALYGTPAGKIEVLLSGVEARLTRVDDPVINMTMRTKYHIGERPYVFAVGTVQPRKNYGRVIQALADLRTMGHDVDLVIAGGRGWLEGPIYEAIHMLKLDNFVHMIGFADDDDLPALYSGALCLAFPSLYEGFGIPILEAMACGTPVVTADVSSLPEVAGDMALLVDPTDQAAITEALRRVIEDSDLRARLIAGGLERVKMFTWERAARQLRAVYGRMLGETTTVL